MLQKDPGNIRLPGSFFYTPTKKYPRGTKMYPEGIKKYLRGTKRYLSDRN